MKKALVAVCSFVIALLVLEGAVRLIFPHKDFLAWQAASIKYQADPCFGWKIVPGEYRETRETIRINSLGLRGGELSREKKPGEVRVFVLGGSSTFNNNSKDGNTWPHLLEKKLRGRFGPGIRVVNVGTPGYSAYQSSKRLGCQLIQYGPDIVLIYHLWNDLKQFSKGNIPALVQELEAHGKFNERTTLNYFAGKIPVWDWLTGVSQIAARLRFAMLRLVRFINKYGDEGKIREETGDSVHPNGLKFYRDNFMRIRNLLAQKGIPFVIVKQGTLAGPDNADREKRRIGYRYTGFDHKTLLEAYRMAWRVNDGICALKGTSCIGANERLPHTLEFFRDHVHLTDRGKERLASVVFEGLQKNEAMVKILSGGSR